MKYVLFQCWFTHSMHRYSFSDWSMEQKWIATLLPLLILYDSKYNVLYLIHKVHERSSNLNITCPFTDPFYPMIFLFSSTLPRLMEILFQTTFYTCLMFFWIAFFHGIRQTNRSFSKFYGPKALLLGIFWFSVTYVTSWSQIEKLEKPTLDEEAAFDMSTFLRLCSFLFYTSSITYFLYLAGLILAAFTELRAMPYFDLRLKLQAFLISFTLTISVLVVLISFPSPSSLSSSSFSPLEDDNEVSRIPLLQLLPWTYEFSSSASFLALFSVTNLYVMFCAYFYYPSTASLMGMN